MRRNIDGTYTNDDRPLLLIFGLLVFAFTAGVGLWRRLPLHGLDILTIGLAIFIGIAIVGALSLPGTRFVFDPNRKLITWRSRSFFRDDGGQLDFSAVQSVTVETAFSNDEGVATYRVALNADHRTLPLSVAYTSDKRAVANLAASIRDVLGIP